MELPSGLVQSRPLGEMAGSEHLYLSVSLAYRDPVAMQSFVDSLSNPHSSNYRHFITPMEVGQRFGPLPSTIQKVRSYLARNGLTIRLVGDNGLSILAEGTVAQAEAAFHTTIDRFAPLADYTPSDGRLYSYLTPPSVPTEIQPYIVDISGLESFSHPVPRGYVTPTQIETLYDVAPMISAGLQGQGRTVGISNWDGYRLSNVPYEYSMFKLPTPSGGVGSNITVETISGGAGAGTEEGEGDLDIQASLAASPACNLIIYDGGNSDLIGVLTQEANDNKADIITESYGWNLGSSTMTAAHNLHLSMSAQGITYMAASGDSGTTLNYYYPNIEPEVLMVGGTTCTVNSSGTRVSEVGWSGSGGGWKPTTDSFNVLPSYQTGTGVPTNIPYRLIPDVALNADPNSGYVVYLDGNYYIIGGTSGASPTFAGCLSEAEQLLISTGGLSASASGHYRFGRIQDLLYSFNGDSSVFYDVTSGSNGQLPNGKTSSAGAGWDFVTGWGAMDFNGFANKVQASATDQFSVAPSSVEGGAKNATGTVTIPTAAPTGGTSVAISGGDSSVKYPSSVTIAAGSRSATFTITTSAVTATDAESLTATIGSTTLSATLTLTPTSVTALTFKPSTGPGGTTFTGTVTLAHAAPAGSGDVVNLSGGDSSVSFPSTVTVAAGATSGTFTMTSTLVAATDVEKLTATLGSTSASGSVTLGALTVKSLSFSPTSTPGGATVTGTVVLSGAAPASGVSLTLSGGDSSISLPSSVTVGGNASSATFKVTTSPVTSSDTETIGAGLGTSTVSGQFTLTAPTVSSLAFSPTSVFGGVSSTGTVTLNGAAGSSGVTVSLSGGDSSVSYPSSVKVASGAKTATFTVSTSVVSASDNETLKATLGTASAGSAGASATLVVKPAGVVSGLTFAPASVVGGSSSTGTVKLASGAGPNGVTISLSGGDSSVSYPKTVSIASGGTSATFTVTTSVVSANVSESLTATAGASSAKGSLTVTAPAVSGLTFSPSSVGGGSSATGTVTLTGPAGTGGLTVTLSGGDSNVTYSTSITIPAGTSSQTFTVTTVKVKSQVTEKITATLGTSSKSGSLTVHP
jgi:hypothetical protein